MILDRTGKPDDLIEKDSEKVKLYGFRPLDITFTGYRRENIKDNVKDDIAAIRQLNKKAKRWYSRLDEMMRGSVVIANPWDKDRMPVTGGRVSLMGGEYYIKAKTHSWQFGGTPKINIEIDRGMVYNNGEMKEPVTNLDILRVER